MKKLKILQVVNLNKESGVASIVMNLYRNINSDKIQFEFITWNIDKTHSYIEEILTRGDQVHIVPYYKKNWCCFKKNVVEILAHGDFYGIHCHEYLVSIPFLYWSKKKDIPLRIIHSHNPTIDSWIKRKITVFSRLVFKRYATTYVACSQDASDFLFGKNVSPLILKNGIDVKKYKYSDEIHIALRSKLGLDNKFVIGNIGRMVLQKNQHFLLHVFAHISNENPNAFLLLIGDGELMPQLKKEAKELGLDNKILFTGIKSNISELLNVMDVFVLPSLYEGLPLVLIEAQANGLPCIISDNITSEVKINSNLLMLSLNDGSKVWSKKIQESENSRISSGEENIANAGFDINLSARILEKLYLQK